MSDGNSSAATVLEFPQRGKPLRDLRGTRLHVRIGAGKKYHAASYHHVVHNNPVRSGVEGVALQTFCRVVLTFIPFDDSIIDDVSPYVETVEYKEVPREGEMCGRCIVSMGAAMRRGEAGMRFYDGPRRTRPRADRVPSVENARMRRAKERFMSVLADEWGVTRAEMNRRGLITYKKDGQEFVTLGAEA